MYTKIHLNINTQPLQLLSIQINNCNHLKNHLSRFEVIPKTLRKKNIRILNFTNNKRNTVKKKQMQHINLKAVLFERFDFH